LGFTALALAFGTAFAFALARGDVTGTGTGSGTAAATAAAAPRDARGDERAFARAGAAAAAAAAGDDAAAARGDERTGLGAAFDRLAPPALAFGLAPRFFGIVQNDQLQQRLRSDFEIFSCFVHDCVPFLTR